MSNVVHILTRLPLDEQLGTSVQPGECLACFLQRMVGLAMCSGSFTWAEHYRDTRAPRAVALERRLREAGASCDCQVLGAVWQLNGALLARDPRSGRLTVPVDLPPCSVTRPRSTRPCMNWTPAQALAQ